MKRAAACLSTLLIATPLMADSERNFLGPWYLSDQESGWYFDAFLGIEREPAYTGSDVYSSELSANFRAFYKSERGHRYFVSLGEFGGFFDLNEDWVLGAVFEYEEGRDNSEDTILTGFNEVEDTLEAQISLFRRWGNFNGALVLQPDILGRGKGFVYFVGFGYDKMLTENLRFSGSLDVSFSDAEHINTEVGITAAEALRTGLLPYNAKGGYKSTTLGLDFAYEISPRWHWYTTAEIEFYGSEMKNSPLIRLHGDSVNYELGLGIRYNF